VRTGRSVVQAVSRRAEHPRQDHVVASAVGREGQKVKAMLRERPVGDARGNKWATPLRQRIQMGELLDYAHASAASSLNKGCSRALHGLTGCDRPRGEACP